MATPKPTEERKPFSIAGHQVPTPIVTMSQNIRDAFRAKKDEEDEERDGEQ